MRLLMMVLTFIFLAGGLSSCSVFEKGKPSTTQSFKHKKPLPKKYIITHKSSNIIK